MKDEDIQKLTEMIMPQFIGFITDPDRSGLVHEFHLNVHSYTPDLVGMRGLRVFIVDNDEVFDEFIGVLEKRYGND